MIPISRYCLHTGHHIHTPSWLQRFLLSSKPQMFTLFILTFYLRLIKLTSSVRFITLSTSMGNNHNKTILWIMASLINKLRLKMWVITQSIDVQFKRGRFSQKQPINEKFLNCIIQTIMNKSRKIWLNHCGIGNVYFFMSKRTQGSTKHTVAPSLEHSTVYAHCKSVIFWLA